MSQEPPYARMLERSPDLICRLDGQYRIRYANPAAAIALGRPPEQLLGCALAETGLGPSLAAELEAVFAGVAAGERSTDVVVELQSPWGGRHFALHILREEPAGEAPVLLLFGHDISAQHKMERELKQLAVTDSLTGLYNRQQFFTLGEKDFIRAKRYLKPLSVMMVDLDQFKPLNDTYGPALGDHVLVRVARELEELLRTSDVLCRFEGGTFVVGMTDTTLEQADRVGRRVLSRIAAIDLEIVDQPVKVTASAGASQLLFNDGGLTDLLSRAEQALRGAKAAGGNALRVLANEP